VVGTPSRHYLSPVLAFGGGVGNARTRS